MKQFSILLSLAALAFPGAVHAAELWIIGMASDVRDYPGDFSLLLSFSLHSHRICMLIGSRTRSPTGCFGGCLNFDDPNVVHMGNIADPVYPWTSSTI